MKSIIGSINFEKSRFNSAVYKRSNLDLEAVIDLRAYIGQNWKDGKKTFHAIIKQQKTAEMSMLISDKVKFKIKNCYKRQRNKLYSDKWINSSRRYNNYKMYASNIRISKHREQILTNSKETIDCSKIIILNFNILLSIMIYTRQKINNDTALQTNQA